MPQAQAGFARDKGEVSTAGNNVSQRLLKLPLSIASWCRYKLIDSNGPATGTQKRPQTQLSHKHEKGQNSHPCFSLKDEQHSGKQWDSLPSDRNWSQQGCQFLYLYSPTVSPRRWTMYFSKMSQDFRIKTPIPSYFWETGTFSQHLWVCMLTWGVIPGRKGRLRRNSGIQMPQSVPDFLERQHWVGLDFRFHHAVLDPTITT